MLVHIITLITHYLFSGAGGVWFSLNGTTYQNNSVVALEGIGEGDDALICVTDNTACCGRAQSPGYNILGDWYYPNGTGVVNTGERWEFYRNRGRSVVRLHRRRGGVTGIYRCVIPDTAGVNQTLYIELHGKQFYTMDYCKIGIISTP